MRATCLPKHQPERPVIGDDLLQQNGTPPFAVFYGKLLNCPTFSDAGQ